MKNKPKRLPLLNYRFGVATLYTRGESIKYTQVEMTRAEYKKIPFPYKGTRVIERSHKIRNANIQNKLVAVFLTDAKEHKRPEARLSKRV